MTKVFERVGLQVYQRDFQEISRSKYSELTDLDDEAFMKNAEDNLLWSHIREAAKQDPILKELLEQCIMHYKITRKL